MGVDMLIAKERESYLIGELHRVIMELTRELSLASRVTVDALDKSLLDEYICKRNKYHWHFTKNNEKQIWIYKDIAVKIIIEAIELNIDAPLNRWAHLKIQGFSDYKVLEIMKVDG